MVWRFLVVFVVAVAAGVAAAADVLLRWNQAGYAPGQPKSVVAMSDIDLRGTGWTVTSGPADSAPVLAGVLGASVAAAGEHTPMAFNHPVDLTELRQVGTYRLRVAGAEPAEIRVAEAPYAALRELPLKHLRMVRSGSDETVGRRLSHPGDARAPVSVVDGDPAEGRWRPAVPARTVDVVGGWYDAGDQIKFTLTNAYTTYHLLLAYRLRPESFAKVLSRSELPDVLDEARHGLEFLMRVFPDRDTFVIQVGDAADHAQKDRLPEDDLLDGRRPALCALSRVHMASAAAALALGARTFGEIGRVDDAARYARQARAIHARTLEPDTIATAFERDKVNDFYRDDSEVDQRALAAMELHALTGEDRYREEARTLAPPPGAEVGWSHWHWLANLALAPHDAGARERLLVETGRRVRYAEERGGPWGLPDRYRWASLHRWMGAASSARLASLRHGAPAGHDALFWSIVDYTFGRNNWGVSFLFTRDLPNTVRHIYGPLYRLLGEFPTGALSEGPGNRAGHEAMAKYFRIPADDPFHRFNTPAAVFFDNATDFMCQETTIAGQADALLLLTLASLPPEEAR